MKMILLLALFGAATAGRLENNYLPPSGAAQSGGAPGAIQAPYAGSRGSGGRAPTAQITKYSNENKGDGTYQYSYETSDGTSQQESGYLKNAGNPETEAVVATGSYSFTGADGVQYTVNWIADEGGFRAEGAHLPTPPPTPDAILRSLEQNAAEEAAASKQTGYTSGPANAYVPPTNQRPANAYVPPRNQPSFNKQSGYNY